MAVSAVAVTVSVTVAFPPENVQAVHVYGGAMTWMRDAVLEDETSVMSVAMTPPNAMSIALDNVAASNRTFVIVRSTEVPPTREPSHPELHASEMSELKMRIANVAVRYISTARSAWNEMVLVETPVVVDADGTTSTTS
eukprot:1209723-Rhodomonas_salina.2